MEIEVFGGVAVLFGLIALVSSTGFTVWAAVMLSLFSATAGIVLTGLGGAPIAAPYVFMVFAFFVFVTRIGLGPMISSLFETRPGLILTGFTLYGLLSAFILPRLLAGITDVYWAIRGEVQGTSLMVLFPLEPREGNLTQSVYLLGALLSFGLMLGLLRQKEGPRYLVTAMIALAVADVGSAVIDLATYLTGTAALLDFIHNSTYAMLVDNEIGGFKRICGFFPEASSFANFNMHLFPFLLSIFSSGVRRELTGPLCSATLLLLVMSTSTTGYVALVVYLTFAGWPMILDVMRRNPEPALVAILAGIGGMALLLAYLVGSGDIADVMYLLDTIIFDKAGSSSGLERGDWTLQAWQNFLDTYGLGAGLGSARASGFAFVLLSNVGAVGSILFVSFLLVLARTKPPPGTSPLRAAVGKASRHAMTGSLIAGMISGTVMDLGLLFYFCAAGAAAAIVPPLGSTVRHRRPTAALPQGSAIPS